MRSLALILFLAACGDDSALISTPPHQHPYQALYPDYYASEAADEYAAWMLESMADTAR